MSAPDIRFDCRFCNKPVNVAAKYAGQRVKCPSCKNPVVVPGERDTLAAGFTEAQTAEGGLQRVSERPIGKRRSSIGLVKLLVLAGLAAAAFFGWKFFQGQSAKPLDTLLKEYAEGTTVNIPLIKRKISESANKDVIGGFELGQLSKYVRHKESGVRATIMECYGLTGHAKALAPLAKALKKDKDADVRRAAAIGLGSIKDKRAISELLAALKSESDARVKGGCRKALIELTGQKQFKLNYEEWKTWWDLEKKRFVFPQ